jgi:hypothetical protein
VSAQSHHADGGDAALLRRWELEPADLAPDLPEAPAERVSWPAESGEDLSVGPGNEMPASQSGATLAGAGPAGPVPGGARRSRGGRPAPPQARRGTPAPAS